MTEVEVIINTRPLTYVYDEFDSGFTLTPAHFLSSYFLPLLMTNAHESDSDYYPVKDSVTNLLESWKKGQRQSNHFWDIWKTEFKGAIFTVSSHCEKSDQFFASNRTSGHYQR